MVLVMRQCTFLSHYVRADAIELCAKFPDWTKSHHKWVEGIANPVLSRKGSAVDDYVDFIAKPGTPVDEVGLLSLPACIIHICVLLWKIGVGQHNVNMI